MMEFEICQGLPIYCTGFEETFGVDEPSSD